MEIQQQICSIIILCIKVLNRHIQHLGEALRQWISWGMDTTLILAHASANRHLIYSGQNTETFLGKPCTQPGLL